MDIPQRSDWSFLQGGGTMGARMRAFDWSGTPLGPPDGWPPALRTTVSLLLRSHHPMALWWGPSLIQFYNDGVRDLLGADRGAETLGARGPESWTEIWATIGPQIDAALTRGESSWADGRLVIMQRSRRLDETYWTYGCSPVMDDDGVVGGVGGVLMVVQEQTWHVIGTRRFDTLRELATRASACESEERVWREAIAVLALNPADLPFVAFYAWNEHGWQDDEVDRRGSLIRQTPGPEVAGYADLFAGDQGPAHWGISRVATTSTPVHVDDLRWRRGDRHGAAWPEPIEGAWVLPVRRPLYRQGSWAPYGVMVAGLSPRLPFDAEYRTFLGLISEELGTALARARLIEEQAARLDALQTIDRTKMRFFGDVSHELRTPLTLMLGPLAQSLARAGDPRDQADLALAHRQALRLQQLAASLIDFSSLEAGRIQATFAPTDLATVTADVASTFRAACDAAGLRLLVDCPPSLAAVHVDRGLWEKVVVNLMANALKFTFEGEIAVALRIERADAILTVRDTGVGIPPHEQPRIFDRFHRVTGTPARVQEGTGIGLALVRELVEMHGGTVAVRSVPDEGRNQGRAGRAHGTTFEVTVPVGTEHLDPDRIRAPRTRSTGAGALAATAMFPAGDAFAEQYSEHHRALFAGEEGGPPIGAARLLVVDDHADMCAYVARLLDARWHVDAVRDGTAALARAREAPPDLVLCDLVMPGLNGLQFVEALRADPRTRDIPVIVLSARADETASVEALEAGADDYVSKPFSTRELMARIGRHLERARPRAGAMPTVGRIGSGSGSGSGSSSPRRSR